MQWRDSRVNLAELAKLRWIEGMSTKVLAERYQKTPVAIENYYQAARNLNFDIPGLTVIEVEKIKWGSKNFSRLVLS